jgi:hypothetical protein
LKIEHEEFMKREINGEETVGESTFVKVNKICEAIKEELWKLNGTDNKYLLPILTTYIKKQPQELK